MKAESENLQMWVPNEFNDPIWRALHILIIYPDESHFDANFVLSFNMFQFLQHTLQLGGPALMYHWEGYDQDLVNSFHTVVWIQPILSNDIGN